VSETTVELRPLAAAVKAQLETVANATGYVNEAVAVPLLANGDGRVEPYWVFHPGGGDPEIERDLADCAVELDWAFQVTCGAGFVEDLQALVDRVNVALFRWVPLVDGLVCGPLRPPPGFRPPLLLDRTVSPHRPYMPLQFTSLITAT
jgi:hypothetical protein